MVSKPPGWGTWGGLLLFYDRNDQTGKGNEYQQELKQFFICNHIHITTPFRLGQGAKKDHPLLSGGQPPTAVRRAANQNPLIAGGNHTII